MELTQGWLITFWIVVAIAVLALMYDALVGAASTWLAENDVAFPKYPWYVRLDYWIYHREAVRVQYVIFEQHRLFGTRLRILGEPITFAKQ